MTIHANFGSFFGGKLGNGHIGRWQLLSTENAAAVIGGQDVSLPLYVQRCLCPNRVPSGISLEKNILPGLTVNKLKEHGKRVRDEFTR